MKITTDYTATVVFDRADAAALVEAIDEAGRPDMLEPLWQALFDFVRFWTGPGEP